MEAGCVLYEVATGIWNCSMKFVLQRDKLMTVYNTVFRSMKRLTKT